MVSFLPDPRFSAFICGQKFLQSRPDKFAHLLTYAQTVGLVAHYFKTYLPDP